jgi:hypothetical protein
MAEDMVDRIIMEAIATLMDITIAVMAAIDMVAMDTVTEAIIKPIL